MIHADQQVTLSLKHLSGAAEHTQLFIRGGQGLLANLPLNLEARREMGIVVKRNPLGAQFQ